MKQKVIEFLQNLPIEKYDQFNQAFELYRKSEGKSFGVERSINASGFSERALENLLYDLQKLHGITDVEKVASVVESQMSKVESEDGSFVQKYSVGKSLFEMNEQELIEWAIERDSTIGDLKEIIDLAKSRNYILSQGLIIGLEVIESKKLLITNTEAVHTNTEAVSANTEPPVDDVIVNTLVQENENLTSENEDLLDEKADLEEENEVLKDKLETLESLPKINAKSIRVEFPFLNDKDCPDEMKILMADKITAWNRYLELHEQILAAHIGKTVASKEYLETMADEAVQAFDENQKIYDELNAYQTTGKVLGLHPIFKKLQLTREVEEMTADELHKYKGSSAKYFSVNKTALAKAVKAKDTVKQEEINSRVTERELKLALVNKKLGINPK
jgi:hypothetical protein